MLVYPRKCQKRTTHVKGGVMVWCSRQISLKQDKSAHCSPFHSFTLGVLLVEVMTTRKMVISAYLPNNHIFVFTNSSQKSFRTITRLSDRLHTLKKKSGEERQEDNHQVASRGEPLLGWGNLQSHQDSSRLSASVFPGPRQALPLSVNIPVVASGRNGIFHESEVQIGQTQVHVRHVIHVQPRLLKLGNDSIIIHHYSYFRGCK